VNVDGLAFDDLDLYGREMNDPLAELEQDVVHLLLESFGSNPDAPRRGAGLLDALSGAYDAGLRSRIEGKLTDDARIDAAKVTLTAETESSVRIDIEIQVNETELGLSYVVDNVGTIVRAS
jgi:hypothetical protein